MYVINYYYCIYIAVITLLRSFSLICCHCLEHCPLPIYMFVLIVPFTLSTSHLALFNSLLCILLDSRIL